MLQFIEIRDMMYILAVCEERSFSRAAEKWYISQPALSKLVKRVEDNLGAQIFDRSSVPLKVTPEGEVFIEYFGRISDIEEEIRLYCRDLEINRTFHLKIGAPSFFCSYVLPPVIAAFEAEHPDIKIKLIETNEKDLKDSIQTGMVNLGISVEPKMPARLDSFVLKEETIILAVPRAYAVNEQLSDFAFCYEDICNDRFRSDEIPAVSMKRFSGEKFLFLKRGNDMNRRGLKICRDAGFEPNIVMEVDQLLSAYHHAGMGAGITFIRASIPFYVGPPEGLIFYKIDHPETKRELRAYYDSGVCTEKQKIFIEYLKNTLMPG